MLKHTLITAVAAAGALAFAASAQAAYLSLGTSNTSNATTTLTGSVAGPELKVQNANGSSAVAFGLYGLLSATAPSVNAAAVRGHNSSSNAYGFGVWGSQAGSGSGVYGYAPSGRGVYGLTASGTGVRGTSTSGTGLLGQHLATSGTAPGVSASTSSTAADADALVATVTPTSSGNNSQAVRGVNNGSGYGIGVWGQQNGVGWGVYGSSPYGGTGVYGDGYDYGVHGSSTGGDGVYGISYYSSGAGVSGTSTSGLGVIGVSTNNDGVYGSSPNSDGVYGMTSTGTGVYGSGGGSDGTTGWAGYFHGNVHVTGAFLSAGTAVRIDHPLDPAHKYLQHSFVESPDMMDVYNGNVTTNGKGFATVTMPRWFQALNRTFRYQLTIVGTRGWNARVVKQIAHNRFTLQSDQPKVRVSWQVTGIRHDRYANAHRIQVVVPKPKAEQGKYVHPELYGKPKSHGIGYQKPPRLPRRSLQKR